MRVVPNKTEMRWNELWSRLGVTDDKWVRRQYCRMLRHYGEPQRFYHVFAHIEYGLGLFAKYRYLANDFDAVLLAWFLHDVIYHTHKRGKRALSNEMLSANYADRLMIRAGLSKRFRQRVRQLILATLHDPKLARTQDQKFMVDVDWSVLGWNWDDYVGYVAKVRKEYGMYNDKEFLVGRSVWIRNSQKDRHFHLDAFNIGFNDNAKSNLERELRVYKDHDHEKMWELR